MLTCQELTELVTDWLEGRLPFRARVSFQLHLGMCWRCRAYLRQLRVTIRTLGKLPDEPMPGDVRGELMARFRDMYPRGSNPGLPPIPTPVRFAAAPRFRDHFGWGTAALAVSTAAIVAIGTGDEEGLILGDWGSCLGSELAGAFLFVAIGCLVVAARRQALPGATFTALSSLGAMAGYIVLAITCPMANVTSHVLLVHVGAILIAALLGSLVPRLLPFRST